MAAAAENDTGLELTTEVAAPYGFAVDGTAYELYTYEHLSKDQEARAQALFRRHTRENKKLADAQDDRSAEKWAAQNRETRIDILTALTNVPRDVVEQLPQPAQARLMKEIGKRMRDEAESATEE
jgi:hypothetical protein